MTLHGACPQGHRCHPRPHLVRPPLDSSMLNFYFPRGAWLTNTLRATPDVGRVVGSQHSPGVPGRTRTGTVAPGPALLQEQRLGVHGPAVPPALPGTRAVCRIRAGLLRSLPCTPALPSPAPIHASKWPKPLKPNQLLEPPLSSILQGPPSCPELNP